LLRERRQVHVYLGGWQCGAGQVADDRRIFEVHQPMKQYNWLTLKDCNGLWKGGGKQTLLSFTTAN
jgi:hypothetical protein